MKFANLLPWVQVLLSSTCAFGQQYFSIHGPLDNSLRVVASATVSEQYYPFDLDPTKVLSRNRSEAWNTHLTSTWNTTVTVGDDDGAFKSLLSLSWPEKEGPTSGPVSNSYGWGACVVAMPGLLDVLHTTGHSNVSCLGTISKPCRDSLMADLLDNFDYPLLDDSGARVNNATAQCEGLSRVQLSPECFGGGDGPGTPFQAYSSLNPINGQPFLLGVDNDTSPETDSPQDKMKARALSRVWPLVVVEFAGDYSILATITCPVADASYATNSSTSSNPQNSTGAGSPTSKPNKSSASRWSWSWLGAFSVTSAMILIIAE